MKLKLFFFPHLFLSRRRMSCVQWAALFILFLSIVSLTTGSEGSQNSIALPGLHSNPLSTPTNSCLLYTQLLEQMRNSRSPSFLSGPGASIRILNSLTLQAASESHCPTLS